MLRFLVIAMAVIVASVSTADARRPPEMPPEGIAPGCRTVGNASANRDIAAVLDKTYSIRGTDLRVCVYRALYPYSLHKGHKLYACYAVAHGSKVKNVCGHGDSHLDYRGYRIEVRLRTPRYTEECDVWLHVEKTTARPGTKTP